MKKTNAQKLTWLRKNKVVVKRGKIRSSTVDRLYSFYQKNPLSTPRNLAYGFPGRIDKALENEKNLRTPKGRITASQYVKTIDKMTAKEIIRLTPENITDVKFSHRFKSGKREDSFRYVLPTTEKKKGRHPGMRADVLNVNDVLDRLRRVYIPDMMEHIDLLYKKRGRFYTQRTVGALIVFETKNMPDDPVPRPVKFSLIAEFPEYLLDMLHELLITDILRNYKDAIIYLRYIHVFIRTRQSPTTLDRYL